MSLCAHGVSSAVSCSGAIPVLIVQTEIGLGKTIQGLPCLESAFCTRRRNMLSMTAGRAPCELVLFVLLSPTGVRLGMGGSWVVPRSFPTLLGRFLVLGVLVSSFVEVVVVVRVAVVVLWRHKFPVLVFLDLDRGRASWGTFGRIVAWGCLHFRNLCGGTRLCRVQEDSRSTWCHKS